MKELKNDLKLLCETMKEKKKIIDDLTQTLLAKKEEYSSLLRTHMEVDRKLAMIDGRYKEIAFNVSGERKESKSIKTILASMSKEQKKSLFKDLTS